MSESSKILLAMPCRGAVPPETLASVALLLTGPDRELIAGWSQLNYLYVDRARNSLVSYALQAQRNKQGQEGCPTHLLLLDADMTVPTDCLSRLLSSIGDLPAASGLYFSRDFPHPPAAWRWDDAQACRTLEAIPETPTIVGGTGAGCLLLRLDALARMRTFQGSDFWFRSKDDGEDVHFCRTLHRLGWGVLLDPEVKCGHVGTQVVGQGHWASARQLLADRRMSS